MAYLLNQLHQLEHLLVGREQCLQWKPQDPDRKTSLAQVALTPHFGSSQRPGWKKNRTIGYTCNINLTYLTFSARVRL
jgi:hypothetical protein